MAIIEGSSNNDELFAEGRNDVVLGLEGNDTLDAIPGQGNNVLQGGEGNDELFANTGDRLLGDEGNDILDAAAGEGANRLVGGDGNDQLTAGGEDTLLGGGGTDLLIAGSQGGRLTGDSGGDFFILASADVPDSPSIVSDFLQGTDRLGINLAPTVTDFEDLAIEQDDNGNTVINTADGDPLALLDGFQGELTADDFVFGGEVPNLIDTPAINNARFTVPSTIDDGTFFGSVLVTGVSEDEELAFTITAGNADTDEDDTAAFAINEQGDLTITDNDDLSTEPIELTVTVTDAEGLSDTASVTITTFAIPEPANTISLTAVGTFETGVFDEGAAEIPAYDPQSQRLFVVNGDSDAVDVLDLSEPTNPTRITAIDIAEFGASPNSVAVANGIVAVAIEAETVTDRGQVAFFNSEGNALGAVQVGALPDALTFSPDGTTVLVANEGEPDEEVDPRGSISIIDISEGVENATVTNAGFTAFNGQEESLRDQGVRIIGSEEGNQSETTAAQDLEPEYVAVSPDGQNAFATLQENNAFAVVDLDAESDTFGTVLDILPLGYDESNTLDASDGNGGINLRNQPVFSMYQPDAITAYEVDDTTYYVTANEGDAREFEEARVEDLVLDPTTFPNADVLQQEDVLGRLTVTNTLGDTDGDGDFDQLFAFGSRSFSIFDETGNLVFDSGDDFERITAAAFPENFNADNTENDFDSRSDAKGPEPEGITIGEIDGRTYAFIGQERIGGIMVYDISDPTSPEYVDYVNNRDFTGDPEAGTAGDLGPEGLTFITAEDSPTDSPLLVVANEVSGSTTVYEITDEITGAPLDIDGNDRVSSIDGQMLFNYILNRELGEGVVQPLLEQIFESQPTETEGAQNTTGAELFAVLNDNLAQYDIDDNGRVSSIDGQFIFNFVLNQGLGEGVVQPLLQQIFESQPTETEGAQNTTGAELFGTLNNLFGA